MIRAILMRMLGLSPIYEVRTVSQLTGKDLPGTKLHGGTGYHSAKAAYTAARRKLKPGHQLRLQAVVTLDAKMSEVSPGEVEVLATSNPYLKGHVVIGEREAMIIIDEAADVTPEMYDIAASNARQSEYMRQHQDEPNFDGPDEDDEPVTENPMAEDMPLFVHEHNFSGPMVYVDGAYMPSCGECGEVVQG